jgi:hypothetical protein
MLLSSDFLFLLHFPPDAVQHRFARHTHYDNAHAKKNTYPHKHVRARTVHAPHVFRQSYRLVIGSGSSCGC